MTASRLWHLNIQDKNSDDITLNLIALIESKTENVRYEHGCVQYI